MLSPCPGMDPFLERPSIFPDFHDRFVSYLSESLQPQMPEIDYRQDAIEPPVQKRDAAFVQAKRESITERPAV